MFKESLIRNIVNIPGWSTKRKIIVFESDDWGSIRMSSKENRELLQKKGFDFSNSPFNLYDSLESNDDLSRLFEVLTKHKDKNGNNPVFTAVSIVGNPNFEKIKEDNYKNYYWESFEETLKKYPKHDKVLNLYKEGQDKRLFVPIFHGREHLNAQMWLRRLQEGNKSVKIAFDYGVTGISEGINGEKVGGMQAAFDVQNPEDLGFMSILIDEGLTEFKRLWNRKSRYFVATNGPFNNSLEKDLKKKGIEYILAERLQKEPYGNNVYKNHIHYMGQQNKLGQTYLTRNGFFEPSIFSQGHDKEPIEKCLLTIERAFRWGKPATISTHRLNYLGFVEPENREKNLKLLNILLLNILRKYPDVEFMTSEELGDLVSKNNK